MELVDDTGQGGSISGVGDFLKQIERALGEPFRRMADQLLTTIVNIFAKGGPVIISLGAAIFGVIVAVRLALAAFKLLNQVLSILWNILKSIAVGFWNVNKAIIQFLAAPVVATVRKSIDVLREYVRILQQVADAAYNLAHQFVTNMVKSFVEFEQNVANAVTRMGEFGAAAMEMRPQVMRAVRDITLTSRKMASEAAESWLQIAAAGVQGFEDLRNMVRGSVVLAEATLSPLQETSKIMVTMMNQFRLSSDQAMRAVNALVAAVEGSPASLSDMANAMKYVGTTAHLFGRSLEETLALAMALFSVGTSPSTVGYELSQIFNALAQASDKTTKTLAAVGIAMKDISPAKKSIVEIVEVFERLRDTWAKTVGLKQATANIAELLYAAFSQRAARGLAGLITVGSEKLREMERSITNTNIAEKMQADQLNTLAGAWDIIRSKWEEIYYVIMERFGPALRRGVEWLKSFVDVILRGVLPVRAGGFLGGFMDTVTQFAAAIGPHVLVAAERLMNALNVVGAGLAASAGAALPSVLRLLSEIPRMFMDMARVIMPALENTIGKVAPFLVDWVSQITPLLADLAAAFLQFLGALASQAGPKIIQWFQTLIGMVIRIFGASEQGIPLFIKYLDLLIEKLPTILEAAIRFLPTLVDLFGSFLDNVAKFIDVYLPMLVQWITDALRVATRIVDETLPMLIATLQKAAPLIADMVRAFLDGIGKALDLIQKLADKWDTVIEPALRTTLEAIRNIIKALVDLTMAWVNLFTIVVKVFQALITVRLLLLGIPGIQLAQKLNEFINGLIGPLNEVKKSLGEVRQAMQDVGGVVAPQVQPQATATMTQNAFAPRSAQGGAPWANSNGSPSLLPAQAAENVNTAAMAKERRAAALRGRGSVDLGFGERIYA